LSNQHFLEPPPDLSLGLANRGATASGVEVEQGVKSPALCAFFHRVPSVQKEKCPPVNSDHSFRAEIRRVLSCKDRHASAIFATVVLEISIENLFLKGVVG